MKGKMAVRILNVPISFHWSFYFLYGLSISLVAIGDKSQIFSYVSTLGIAFFCIILHEFGHILSARRYNIDSQKIVVHCVGAVAYLNEFPREPKKEFFITIAGPAVNAIIALSLFTGHVLSSYISPSVKSPIDDFIVRIIILNVVLVLFNLIPLFPMDGGRLLRASLTWFFNRSLAMNEQWLRNYLRATRIAVTCSVILGVAGLFVAFYYQSFTIAIIAPMMTSSALSYLTEERKSIEVEIVNNKMLNEIERLRKQIKNNVDKLVLEGRTGEVDYLMFYFNPEQTSSLVIMDVLKSTKPIASRLCFRNNFIEKSKETLIKRNDYKKKEFEKVC